MKAKKKITRTLTENIPDVVREKIRAYTAIKRTGLVMDEDERQKKHV